MLSSNPKHLYTIAASEFIILCLFGVFYFGFYKPKHVINPVKISANETVPTSTPTISADPTSTPTLEPTPTEIKSATKTYKDLDYGFKVNFPSNWTGVLNQKVKLALETYTITSPDEMESLEIMVSEGIWANVKLELGPGSKKSTFLGQPCLIRENEGNTIYIFPSTTDGQIIRLTINGATDEMDKILNSFKFF